MTKETQSKKFIFELNVVDDWPPVAAESLWLDVEGKEYRVKTVPFFLPEIAYDDLISIVLLSDTSAKISRVISRSGNSTVWVYFLNKSKQEETLAELGRLGIGVEGGAFEGYYALNLPKEVSLMGFNGIIKPLKDADELEVVFGCRQHT